jgi:uncharacterized membrane protein YiaA
MSATMLARARRTNSPRAWPAYQLADTAQTCHIGKARSFNAFRKHPIDLIEEIMPPSPSQAPSGAFVAASWAALLAGSCTYLIGLWNAAMLLNEKGYYFTLLMYGLFAAVSLQKTVRDKLEGVRVTGIYFALCWVSVVLAVSLLTVGLWNATLAPSEKGFYAMSFVLSLFAAVAVQKNTRDANSAGAAASSSAVSPG